MRGMNQYVENWKAVGIESGFCSNFVLAFPKQVKSRVFMNNEKNKSKG